MTKTGAKTGGRETLKDGLVSKLQRHIVLQRKLLIVYHLFSSTDIYVCFRTPGIPPCRFCTCLESYATT